MTRRRAMGFVAVFCLAIAMSAAPALGQGAAVDRRVVEDPLFGITSVVPAGWQELGGGTYARGTPPDDLALIAIQSAAASTDQMWDALLPQLALTTIPAVGDTYTTERFEWSLFPVSIELGDRAIAVEVALAEDGADTHLVLLQAAPDEFAALRDQVLLPALDAFAPLAPTPTPHPSTFDYQILEVTFPGAADGVELAGTLTLPPGPGPHPVVITMSGSGPSDRDESLAPLTLLQPFAVIADALTSSGVGVLRYDDRGVGASSGDHAAATIDDFTADARAAIDYLETRDDVDPDRIGLFGHSEGGMYAAKLGASDPRVAYIAMLAPAIVDGVTLIVDQQGALLRAAGESEEIAAAASASAAEVMPVILEGDTDRATAMVQDYYGDLWDGLNDDQRSVLGEREAFAERSASRDVDVYGSDWFRSLLGYDPTSDWARVTVPVLAIFGGKDAQVLAAPNLAALQDALDVAGNDQVETIVIPEANHLFQAAETGAVQEYPTLEPAFVEGLIDAIVAWATQAAGVAQ